MIKLLGYRHFYQKNYRKIHQDTLQNKKQTLQKMLDFRKQCSREGIRYDGK